MVLKAEQVSKYYMRSNGDANCFEAVKPCDLTLAAGSVSVLMGRSGSGKTTLLTMLSGLLRPSHGSVLLDEKDIYALTDRELSRLRCAHFAVIPQGTGAISALSVLENILLPFSLIGRTADENDVLSVMGKLGILHLASAQPGELSGGELRRMAIARALCIKPGFIFADEPTADLDDENSRVVLELLRNAADKGAAVLIVSHETDAARYGDTLYKMNTGQIMIM